MADVTPVAGSYRNTALETQDPEQPKKVITEGRGWRYFGYTAIGVSILLTTVSILAICVLTTKLGNTVSKWGQGGANMVNFMGKHANAFMIGGLAGSAGGIVLFGTGILSAYKGKRDYEAEILRRAAAPAA